MNKKFSNYPNYIWLIFFVFYFLLSNTNAQIYDGTYTGTFSGSIIKEYDAGKTKITTTPKQISFIVSTKNGLQIDGEIVGEWEYLGEMYGKPSIEKKDWSKSIMICRTDLADSSALSKIKLLNFSCQGHAYIDVITLTGTISNGLMTGKWQTKDTPTASGTFQATTSSNSTLFPKPETRIDSGVRFSSVSGQVEIWHENETENDSRIAKIDTVLYEGDHIKTAEDATCILSFADMSNFVMKPETHIILAKTKGPESKLKLVIGNMIVNFKKMIKDGSMEIDCDQALAGTRGTTFELWEFGQKIGTTLRVEEGTVEFRHKTLSKTMLVTSGQTVSANATGFIPGKIEAKEKLAELPTLEGTWKGTFNGYSTVMEIAKRNDQYEGRFNVDNGSWSQMLDFQVIGNTISFRREAADQPYTAIIGNGTMDGTFSQQGGGKYIWSMQRVSSLPNTIESGKTIDLPVPTYPPSAKAVQANGRVEIQVTVDENGNVISALAISGHPLLRTSAEAAARQAKFSPMIKSGQTIKITKVIVYDFDSEKNTIKVSVEN